MERLYLPAMTCILKKFMIRSGEDESHENDGEAGLIVEVTRLKPKPPPMYKVVLNNDDYTPMEFVVHVLETFFRMNREKATQIMLHVHTRGKGICGVFTREIAETKMTQVNEYSKQNEHPLLCTMEEA